MLCAKPVSKDFKISSIPRPQPRPPKFIPVSKSDRSRLINALTLRWNILNDEIQAFVCRNNSLSRVEHLKRVEAELAEIEMLLTAFKGQIFVAYD